MDWPTIQTAIPLAIQTALGDLAFDAGWVARESRWRTSAHVRLRVLSVARKGQDERRTEAEGPDDVRERVYGVRVLRVQVTCETQDQDLTASAWDAAERIVAGLRASDAETILDTAALGLSSITAPKGVDYFDESGRERSAVVFDLAFNAHVAQVGPLVPRIKSVEFEGTISNGPDIGPETVTEP